MTKYGYVRFSVEAQKQFAGQEHALVEAGVDPESIFSDVAAGGDLPSRRDGFGRMEAVLQAGDEVVVKSLSSISCDIGVMLGCYDALAAHGVAVTSLEGEDPEKLRGVDALNQMLEDDVEDGSVAER